MIPFTSGHRYFVYSGIVDFRKGYNGLSGVVKSNMESNPFNGDVYIFFNKRNNQIRMLVYDSGGLVILSKQLEKGTFENSKSESSQSKINITWTQLMCIMQGIKLSSIKFKKRYHGCDKMDVNIAK